MLSQLEAFGRPEDIPGRIILLEHVLTLVSRTDFPSLWAELHIELGNALRRNHQGDKRVQLMRAITCFDIALTMYTREETPTDWAKAQQNRGIALSDLVWLLEDTEEQVKALRTAIICYDAVLTVYTHEAAPFDWAEAQNNKATALSTLAWLQKNMGKAERVEALHAALGCYDAALTVFTRETAANWAMAENNKGNALTTLAGLLEDAERVGKLQAAIICYDNALLEQRCEPDSTDWAATQYNKGNALRKLAALSEGTEQAEKLRAAVTCYNNVLLARSPGETPANWITMQDVKANMLKDLVELLKGKERVEKLREVIACYDAVLTIATHAEMPTTWAKMQHNKGIALRDLAGMSEGNERAEKLREAIACYDAVLSIYTRQVLPADHRRLAQSVGMMLFKEGDWKSAARYLSTALDALDDLFTLEVTTYGRKSTLKAGGDLAAHLAYALIRTDQVDAAWQAIEALERGRARATGEAIAYQEAQVAVAKRLTPDLLERFREVSNRLVTISLVGGTSDASRTVQATDTMSVVGDAAGHTAMAALNMQLAGYEEAREARAVYNGVVAEIRGKIPDFLKQGEALKSAVELLASDECLVYIASTPVGALVVLVSGPCGEARLPIVERWWDERLTSMEVTRLLVGSPGEEREHPEGSVGLLAAQSDVRKLGEALRVTMQALGVPDGVLARLATYCRAAGLRRLGLVPCGLLGLLPLHAALVPTAVVERSEPLLDVVQVSYTPSARIWAACRRRVASSSVEVSHTLVVSDPQPQASEVRLLPYAKDEGQVISRIVTSNADSHVFVFKDETATLPDILNVLQEHGDSLTHVHFACHGLAKLTDPQTSGLLLAYGARLMTRDLLDPTVIHFERLRLAVLSACQTALSGTELPDEVVGLPSGWLQAGAMGVLASLWPVSDNVTVALMKKFYELHLLDRLDPEPALWLAQRWFRRLPTWRQNCLAAGAVHAAEGPEVSEVVHELALIRGETMPLDDLENLAGVEIGSEATGNGVPDDESAAWKGVPPSQYRRWEHARHWAAFAIYGA